MHDKTTSVSWTYWYNLQRNRAMNAWNLCTGQHIFAECHSLLLVCPTTPSDGENLSQWPSGFLPHPELITATLQTMMKVSENIAQPKSWKYIINNHIIFFHTANKNVELIVTSLYRQYIQTFDQPLKQKHPVTEKSITLSSTTGQE